ncbi:DUF4280 domain-containing protein [Flavobacterium sp. F-65]|uniref:DUF4280 domain-containing protein n=1 Tax=Flavobacterium pisciphilum TaxID=2893755 RepID=A0ABS8MZV4_9FLAO|nr:DUF4280 domain-containing protein [Flavobacterium sp. F-65]MCC9073691.1 DUF4280 domain-containing protein [Flavobacterium sp. F-65]
MEKISDWLDNFLMGGDENKSVNFESIEEKIPVEKHLEERKLQIAEIRKKREEKEEAENGLKFVIDGAKIKCNLCTVPDGDLKVNYDTPTIQDKRVATVVEKDMTSLLFKGNCKKSPLSASPCASVMKLGDWKDVGTVYFQNEFPLLLKSTIKCEYGGVDITITDCAQRNEITNLDTIGVPVPSLEIIYVNGHFYNINGTFEGKVNEAENSGSIEDVYICTGKSMQKNSDAKEIMTYNGIKLLKENDENIPHEKFINNSYLIWHEASLTGNIETAFWIAHTVNNALHSKYKRGKNSFNKLFKTGYSSVKESDKIKTISITSNTKNHCFARSAMISVLKGDKDPTSISYFWDGLDLFTRSGELDHPKFKQYKSVTIVKSHLDLAIEFWSIDSNRAKVNKNAKLNSVFSKEEYTLKDVTDGSIINENGVFSGARANSQNNNKVHERLKSTGFKSGTMFWTTF